MINNEIREKIGKESGDLVDISIMVDASPVIIVLPNDLKDALKKNSKARKFFESIAPSHKKAFVQWIENAKMDETRKNRVEKAVDMLSEGKKL